MFRVCSSLYLLLFILFPFLACLETRGRCFFCWWTQTSLGFLFETFLSSLRNISNFRKHFILSCSYLHFYLYLTYYNKKNWKGEWIYSSLFPFNRCGYIRQMTKEYHNKKAYTSHNITYKYIQNMHLQISFKKRRRSLKMRFKGGIRRKVTNQRI